MKRLKKTVLIVSILFIGSILMTGKVQAAACELVDPINGTINITCSDAHLSLSENGVRDLPLPSTVPLHTKLRVDWVLPFSGNTWLESWDSVNQTSHYWEKVGRIWVNNPINAVLQENGTTPWVNLEVKKMPNRQKGWAIIQRNDLLLWNGGN